MTLPVPAAADHASIETLDRRLRTSRDAGAAWLLRHIAPSGEPDGARERNGWARVPWALALAGEIERAAAVLAWAERHAVSQDGYLSVGPAAVTRFPAYPMAHLAIGAWLAERYGLALRIMNALRQMQDADGGLPIAMPGTEQSNTADLLSTAQAGQAAIITGQHDMADACFRWVSDLLSRQPEDAGTRFYSFRRDGAVLVESDGPLAWASITDFNRPRQSFYTAGMAAVFLTSYGSARDSVEAQSAGRALLQRNIEGCPEQFEDHASVQICKFGWGAALTYPNAQNDDLLPDIKRMAEWFMAHQASDGSWSPSAFLVPAPTNIDQMVKTSEHVVEVNAIFSALGTAKSRSSVNHD